MKVAILAGGIGTRLSKETVNKPKALVEIGGQPILWHIMMHYSRFGFHEFIIALCYKCECNRRRQYSMGKRTLGKISKRRPAHGLSA
jgi:NDP-sugar pyrophosphorylase family protein